MVTVTNHSSTKMLLRIDVPIEARGDDAAVLRALRDRVGSMVEIPARGEVAVDAEFWSAWKSQNSNSHAPGDWKARRASRAVIVTSKGTIEMTDNPTLIPGQPSGTVPRTRTSPTIRTSATARQATANELELGRLHDR